MVNYGLSDVRSLVFSFHPCALWTGSFPGRLKFLLYFPPECERPIPLIIVREIMMILFKPFTDFLALSLADCDL